MQEGTLGRRASKPLVDVSVRKVAAPPHGTSNPTHQFPKVEIRYPDPRSSLSMEGRTREGFPIVGAGAYAGLSALRNKIAGVVDADMAKLKQDRADCRGDVAKLGSRLGEEKERLKYIHRKLNEKRDTHDRATEEYRKAHAVLVAARIDKTTTNSPEHARSKRAFVRICEALAQSWFENKKNSEHRLSAWEFRCRRQSEIMKKVQKELELAEATYADTVMHIDTETANLQSLAEVLQRL